MLASAGALCFTQSAYAATHTVDDDKADCPAAAFTSIQAAIDAAAPGDTIAVCQGDYVEGNGAPGTNALTITKDLTLKGAGADYVSISPKAAPLVGGRILEAEPDLRNGVGDILAIVGTPTQPLTVHISGVTVDGYDAAGRAVAVEAGILFLDAKGSVSNSHVTNVVTSEGDNAFTRAGGWRGEQPGIGIAQTSTAMLAPVDGARRLEIDRTRVDKYNRVGVLIDGAQNDFAPFMASGTINWGVITASQIIGRTLCVNYAGTGSCNTPGLVTSGPLFGQDGLRVTAGSYATVDSTLLSQNLVNGTGAPVRGAATNNANLNLAAGARFAGAKLTSYSTATGAVIHSFLTRSNIVDNAYGVLNLAADGATTLTGNPNANAFQNNGNLLKAENNWWGVRNNGTGAVTPPPPISPATNPPVPENPVNGTATVETATGDTTSNSVDFFPYRSGPQSDPITGAWPVLTAPLPVDDAVPTGVTLSAPASAKPDATITLTATGSDDFGIKRVRFADGATTLSIATLPPYTATATIPAGAACNSTRTYSAIVMDSAGQTASASASVVVDCTVGPEPTVTATPTATATATATATTTATATPEPRPATPTPTAHKPPSVAFIAWPTTISRPSKVSVAPTAEAGLKQVELFLGNRLICTRSTAPFECTITPTGADVGGQALRAIVTDVVGSSGEASRNVVVSKFAAKVSVSVATRALKGGKVRRTISGKVAVPAGVTRAQGCTGSVTLTIKRAGRSVLNQKVALSKSCTFKRSVTAGRGKQSFSASVKFGGNTVLSTASKSRRFS